MTADYTRNIQNMCTNLAGETELVLGHVYGLRQWTLRDGLRGHRDYIWVPGQEHAATCLVNIDIAYVHDAVAQLLARYGRAPADRSEPAHQVTDPDCTCGFYAYTEAEPLLKNSVTTGFYPAVFGLVKAWGHVTQGTHGFRAEKAQIVALTRPLGDLRYMQSANSLIQLDEVIAADSLDRWVDVLVPPRDVEAFEERLRDTPDVDIYPNLPDLLAAAEPLLKTTRDDRDS